MRQKNAQVIMLVLLATIWGSPQVESQTADSESATEPPSQRVLISEVAWGPLNPARGDKGPKAGTLWGDRTAPGPSGFLVQFVDGFSSPPHIHNVSYRGVVLSGLLHNDDPGAEEMWMPAGSFWTQPAGEVHITAAEGEVNLAYIEIEDGPYLVRPTDQAFDNGERPVNVDAKNIVWLDSSNITWIDSAGTSAAGADIQLAYLWGHPQGDQLNGTLVKLPAGVSGELKSHGSEFRAVSIQGLATHRGPGETTAQPLEPGSYFGSLKESVHQVSCGAEGECLLYIRTEGRFDVLPLTP